MNIIGDMKLFWIGEFVKIVGVSEWMIDYYMKFGLIVFEEWIEKNYCLYSNEILIRFECIV